MGKLDGACGYLSGSIEYANDHGIEWRRSFIRYCKTAKLNVQLIDPTDKPGGEEIKIGENKEFQVNLQKSGKFLELRDYVHRYRRYDLRFVDISDFLVVVVDPTIPQWGTANEVYEAERQHKPCFFVCKDGLYNLPRWLFDVVEITENHCNVYEYIEDVVIALQNLDDGLVPLSDKWVLIRKALEERKDHQT